MLDLPRIYKNRNGNFPQHEGKPKISYSMHESWNSSYRPDVALGHFFGLWQEGGIYADFGGAVGEYIEKKGQNELKGYQTTLHKETTDKLDKIEYPDNCIYEEEVVIDFGDFVMEGYIDRAKYEGELKTSPVHILDFKTGNLNTKPEKYGGKDYSQTILYGYGKQQQGVEVKSCGVMLLGRKGSNFYPREGNLPILYLTGDNMYLDNIFNEKTIEYMKKQMIKTAKDISAHWKFYKKYIDINN